MWVSCVYSLFERNKKLLVLSVIVDSEDSDWLAWLYTSPYTAAYRFGIVVMALDGVFMPVDVNEIFFEYNVMCTMLLLKTEGGIFVSLNSNCDLRGVWFPPTWSTGNVCSLISLRLWSGSVKAGKPLVEGEMKIMFWFKSGCGWKFSRRLVKNTFQKVISHSAEVAVNANTSSASSVMRVSSCACTLTVRTRILNIFIWWVRNVSVVCRNVKMPVFYFGDMTVLRTVALWRSHRIWCCRLK